MKYWVYINNKVDGPYDENDLPAVEGFTPQTLICSEEVASKGGQEWVKASSVFEFDEEPAQEPTPQPETAQPAANTSELLARLEVLTSGMSSLQSKFETLQSHLDKALEENKKLAAQVAAQQSSEAPLMASEEDSRANTITLTRHDIASQNTPEETPSYPQQATPQEDELIIRSALDSMYGGKPLNADSVKEPLEDTFHDLVTGETSADLAREEEEQAVEEIATQLHFTPVEDEQPTQQEPVVENAVITTPSVFEAEKDALINELTSSAKEDVLDQIIAEHQAASSSTDGASLAAAGAVAGLAAAALATAPKQENQASSFAIAPDKENPQHLEEVLPADQLPEDVLPPTLNQESAPQEQVASADLPSVAQEPDVTPIAEEKPQEKVDLPVADLPQEDILVQPQEQEPSQPQLAVMDTPQELPQAEPVVQEPTELPTMDESVAPAQEPEVQPVPEMPKPQEEALEELVPATPKEAPANEPATTAQPEPEPLPEQPAQEVAQEPVANEQPAPAAAKQTLEPQAEAKQEPPVEQQESANSDLTDKDLQDAFGSQETEQPSSAVQDVGALLHADMENAEGNPNELTEIELKAGSTYLISDFVPPTQVEEGKEQMAQPMQETSKKQETIFQDMLAASTIGQSATSLNTDGLPEDVSATQINLENTIQAKRGASFDIKTVPMVPDPAQTDRLDMNDLNDVNAQHDIKTQGPSKSAKWVVRGLIALLALIVLYVVLSMLHLLPSNSKEAQQAQAVQNTQAILQEEGNAQTPLEQPAPADTPTAQDQALEKVQNFPLPNGYSLKGFIESKHATISPELITWEVADAVEPDNYSVTVKVPPENPQNFKTVYRFNYNMQTGLLDPTISDAKNLLDQAYGINPAQSVATAATAPAQKTATKRATTRRATTRRR